MSESIDGVLKEMPSLDSGNKPDLEDIIYNLNGLMGYLLADEMLNGVRTLWWAEQMLKRNTNIEA